MALPGDLGFLTGLNMGRRETSEVAAEWKQYAQGLHSQISELSQKLREECAQRAASRATVEGLIAAINGASPGAREEIMRALDKHFDGAFLRRAAELGLPDWYAGEAARNLKKSVTSGLIR